MSEANQFSRTSKSFVSCGSDGFLTYDSSAAQGRTACIQGTRPWNVSDGSIVYFEVLIAGRSSTTAAIGLAGRGFFRTGKHVGAAAGTFGWDGVNARSGDQSVPLPAVWQEGDVVGCGWEPERRVVFFTHNGVRLGKELDSGSASPLLATLSFSGSDTFLANFGGEDFVPFQHDVTSSKSTVSRSSSSAYSAASPSAAAPIRRQATQPQPQQQSSSSDSRYLVHLAPHEYVHVLNRNANLVSLVTGPETLTLQQNEEVVDGPSPMIVLPPQHYCQVTDPVKRLPNGKAMVGAGGFELLHGDSEIRFAQDPFPLYPGEKLSITPRRLPVIAAGEGCILRAKSNFVDEVNGEKINRIAGEEWQVVGPCTLIPRKEELIKPAVKGHIIQQNEAIVVRSLADCVDAGGKARKAGETYLVRDAGCYLPTPDETIIERRTATILSDTVGLHLRANIGFVDMYGTKHDAGSEWVLTNADAETHIPDVHETLVRVVPLIVLGRDQYCFVRDPICKDGRPRLGERELRKGPRQFFLQPGEEIEDGVKRVYVLDSDDALLLRAKEAFTDPLTSQRRIAGERWLVRGPLEVTPDVNVEVVESRRTLAFEQSEGVYVLNRSDGSVRSVVGQVYMLAPEEEYWQKNLPPKVEELVEIANGRKRAKHEVVTIRVPHNCAVRVFDHNANERVCFGPDLVLLQPDEEVQLISLSAGHPKVPNTIQTLCLRLGPDFMADTFSVDTSDHARLNLRLAYSWRFEVDKTNAKRASGLFCVNDFVGDACRTIAGKVRAAVSSVTFDEFHKNSASIIAACVLGPNGSPLKFVANNFLVTDVDVQRVEPSNAEMQKALASSVQQAIEITTKATEMRARQAAELVDQLASGKLLQQKLKDDGVAEAERQRLLHTLAEGAALRSTGVAMAEAKAKAEAARIEGESEVEMAKFRAEALRLNHAADLARQKSLHEAELEHMKKSHELEIEMKKELAQVQQQKFASVVQALGADTIAEIALSKRRSHHALLQGLGIKQVLFTGGSGQQLNLFTSRGAMPATMQRMVGPPS